MFGLALKLAALLAEGAARDRLAAEAGRAARKAALGFGAVTAAVLGVLLALGAGAVWLAEEIGTVPALLTLAAALLLLAGLLALMMRAGARPRRRPRAAAAPALDPAAAAAALPEALGALARQVSPLTLVGLALALGLLAARGPRK